MARIPDLIPFCREHGLRILTVAELIRYRLRHERYIVRAGEARIQTRYGEFRMIAYESEVNGGESHIALVRGDLCPGCPAFEGRPSPRRPSRLAATIARPAPAPCWSASTPAAPPAMSSCADCHCREILDHSMRIIAKEGCGAILYLHNTSRGFAIDHAPLARNRFTPPSPPGAWLRPAMSIRAQPGRLILHGELRAREAAQDRSGRILRAIGLGGQILSDLGIQRIRLLSNTPMHIPALEGFGLEIVEQVPIPIEECTRAV